MLMLLLVAVLIAMMGVCSGTPLEGTERKKYCR